MQYIIPRDDTSSRSLSLPERTFLRNAARGVSSSAGSILRLDGRAPSEARPIRLSFSRCHNRAECTVQLGNGTRSAASVRAELVPPPNADRPNDGQIKFGVEVGPMGCMGFENTVPVSNYAVGESVDGGQAGSGGGGDVPYVQRLMSNRILRLLERTLLIGGSIDAEALCVQSGVWVWRLHVDVSLLDDGGNAMDACVLAAVAALRHYRLPEVSIGGDGDDVETSEASAGSILRLDGRAPSEARPIRLSFSRCHNRAECTVQLGNGTRSAASVRAELVPPPNADRPNDGQIKFGVEVGPMGCMGFENTVPVSNYAVGESVDGGQAGSGGGGDVPYVQRLMSNRILRLLERTLLIGGSIDAEALCVQSGVWVWRLHVDVSLLDDGGNAMDACVLAAVAALRHYRLPEVSIGGDGDDVETSEAFSSGYQETNIIHSDDREPTPLPLHHTPLTATFALFADETGTTTAVSALLDPYDREELASDGLLTWSFNKYGEMCCVDFPGGCELRPRQLTASSNLGKRRCIEICELLETALEEAESKAQQDRMDRLKQMNAMRQKSGDTATLSANIPVTDEDEEDEQYRLRALDYSSGHVAAPVKEDKEKKGSQGKNMKGETSSLFHAILRSAQSTSLEKPMDEDEPLAVTRNDRSTEKKSTVEIVAHKVKQPAATITKKTEPTKSKVMKSPKPVQPASMDDSDEEEVVQLQSEFTALEQAPDQGAAASMDIDSNDSTPAVVEKVSRSKKSKSATRTEAAEEDDVDDLAMAVKKKKKSKKK